MTASCVFASAGNELNRKKNVLPEIRFGQKTDAKDCDAYPRGSYFPKTTAKPDADTDTDSKGR